MSEIIDRLREALKERYKVESELGRGGTAIVFLAYDWKHSRKVAIKVLRPELGASIGARRFLKEIATAAQLQHPRILGLHDSGEADGLLYYVMPFVEGESLRDRLEREHKLTFEDAIAIVKEVADGLGHAHSLGIVHRDVKPENIMITGGHAIVTDFGIARALDEAGADRLTETGLAVGTPMYMSPEQATGAKIDQRSDIYSLACVVYEMLIAEPPFTGPTAKAIMLRHSMDPVPSLRTVHAAIPPAAEHAIMKALAKTPADRFQTTDQFVEALTSADIPSVSRARVFAKRLVPGAVASALVAGVVWVLWPSSPAADPATPLDPSVVAIFPFGVTSADPSHGVYQHSIPQMMRRALRGGERPLAYDLAAIRNATRVSEGEQVALADAFGVARDVGAGRVLRGTVIGTGGATQLNATLYDTQSEAQLAVATVPVGAAGIDEAVERLTVATYVASLRFAPRPPDSASDRHAPETLWSFYAGHEALRRGAYDSAAVSFERALNADTALAAASVGWLMALHHGAVGATLAWNVVARDALTKLRRFEADSALVMALVGSRPGDVPSAEELIRLAEAALGSRPEGSGILAEHLARYGAYVGDAMWRQKALGALDRVPADAWSAPLAMQDLVVRTLANDSAGIAAARDRIASLPIDSVLADLASWVTATGLGRAAELDSSRSRTDNWSSRTRWLEHLGLYSAFLGASFDDWKLAVDAVAQQQVTMSDRLRVLSQQFAIAASEGRRDSATSIAQQILTAAPSLNPHHVKGAIALAAMGDSAYAAVAAKAAGMLARDTSALARCYVSVATPTSRSSASRGSLCEEVIAVLSSSNTSLERLETRMRVGPREPAWELGNLVLAQRYLARGDTARAIAAARRRAVHPDWIVLLPLYKKVERQIGR